MEILPLHPAENAASPDALRGFLAQCRDAARRDRHDKLVSISMALPPPDPLAALDALCERVAGFGADVSVEWLDGYLTALVCCPSEEDQWHDPGGYFPLDCLPSQGGAPA